jgi:DNA repair exonuclease SbcCD ATPase subunit
MAHISNIRLTGVIYLQRITDNRMQGSATRNLRLLKELCGPENYGNLVLVTTMWSRVDLAEGTRRELQLRSNNKFWGEFIRQGATVRKYEGGKESAISIVRHLLKKTPVVLKFQRELAEAGIIASTSAGEELIRDLAVMKENTKNRIEKLQQDLEKTTGVRGLLEAENKELVEKLNEKAAMEKKLEEKDKEMAEQIEKLSADLTQRMEKLQEDLKQSTKDKGALEGEIVTLREKGRKMSEEIQNLGKDLEQRIDENEELRQRVESDGQRQGRWPRCAVQ